MCFRSLLINLILNFGIYFSLLTKCYFMETCGLWRCKLLQISTMPPLSPWWKKLTLMFLNIIFFLTMPKKAFSTWQAMKHRLLFSMTFTWPKPFLSLLNEVLYWKKSVYFFDEISAVLILCWLNKLYQLKYGKTFSNRV